MRRFNLVVLLVVTMVLWSTGVSFADKRKPVLLTPVTDSPSPAASGILSNITYDTYVAWDDYGNPIGKVGVCGAYFQFRGLKPNAWYNLRGILVTYTGYPDPYAFASPDFADDFGYGVTFYTDANGNAEGRCIADYLPPRQKFAYFELWTGNYSRDDRTQMLLVLDSE